MNLRKAMPGVGGEMNGITVRIAAPGDFRAFTGFDVPPDWCIAKAVGYIAERDGRIIAAGLVTWDIHGRAWGWLNGAERLPAIALHRRAKAMLALLREVGEPLLYAFCSQTIPGAETWLRRLGFRPAPELTSDPLHPVWACCLQT